MAITNTIANTSAATVTNLFKMMRCTMPPSFAVAPPIDSSSIVEASYVS
jgi:hypothetical protein